TIECSCRLCPSPGMYAVTSMPLDSRTRATLRSAELGFFGVCVNTRVHTPRRCGDPASAGVFVFENFELRPCRTSCWLVGTNDLLRCAVDPEMLSRLGGSAYRDSASRCGVVSRPVADDQLTGSAS